MRTRLSVFAAFAILFGACVETPSEVAVTGIELSDKQIELIAGQTHTLTATVLPEDATNKAVQWVSLVPNVASVDDNGLVIAKEMGATTIDVTTADGGFKASCAVIVKMRVIPVESVTLNYDEYSIDEGGSLYLSAKVYPKDATNPNVIWSAEPASVLEVDNIGKVTAVGPGEGDVTVTTEDGGFTASCHITVIAKVINAESVTVAPASLELTEGETAQLTATVLPENTTDKTLEWRSTNSKVATVSDEGLVTAVGEGKATITAYCGAKTGTCEVTVKKVEVTGVTVTPPSITIMEGETHQLTATVSPAEADQTVQWASNDSNVAKVDATGLVTAVKAGSTRIYSRSKAFTDQSGWCDVTVTQDVTLKGISLSSAIMTLMVGESRTLTVTYNPSYASNKNITWSSSSPGVAAVSDGTVTAFAEGKATITATSEEGGHTATCEVTVSGSAGPMVYYWHGSTCYVNGAPDPRNGMFDKSGLKLYTTSAAKGADVFGKSLYSLERYNEYGRDIYLCRDREPLRKIPDELRVDGTKEVIAFCAQEGYYAILQQKSRGTQYSVWRGTYDGDPVEIPITGSFKSQYGINYLKMRALPDGRIIVSAKITNAYDENFIATYTILPGSESTDETIVCAASYAAEACLDVDEDGNVYLLKIDYPGNGEVGYFTCHLYKNGELVSKLEKTTYRNTAAIACSGGHVYIAVFDQDPTDQKEKNELRILKDGELLYAFKGITGIHYQWNRPIRVTPSGDVYVAVHTSLDSSALYKNGELLYSASYWAFNYYCVIE